MVDKIACIICLHIEKGSFLVPITGSKKEAIPMAYDFMDRLKNKRPKLECHLLKRNKK